MEASGNDAFHIISSCWQAIYQEPRMYLPMLSAGTLRLNTNGSLYNVIVTDFFGHWGTRQRPLCISHQYQVHSVLFEGRTRHPLAGAHPDHQLVRPDQLCLPSIVAPATHSTQSQTGGGDGHPDHPILASPVLVSSSSPHVKVSVTPTPNVPATTLTTQLQTQTP